MAYEIGEVITLGIGTPSEIGPLITFGLTQGTGPTMPYIADMDTRLLVYLRTLYSVPTGDLTTLVRRYLDAQTTGSANQRMQKLIADATAAMLV